MIKVAPSLLSADFLELRRSIDLAVKAGADYLHYDVMDGNFVPNISFGQGILKAVAGYGALPVDAHLMVDKAVGRYPRKRQNQHGPAGLSLREHSRRHVHS